MTGTLPAAPTGETHDRLLDADLVGRLSRGLVQFLETNTPPEDLFAIDAFCDLSVPEWRYQAEGRAAVIALRRELHPDLGRVSRWRSDALGDGLVFEFEERWTDREGRDWYCREMLRATVRGQEIAELSIYCTGDWSEAVVADHAKQVTLVRR
jgi:hypothetical protein